MLISVLDFRLQRLYHAFALLLQYIRHVVWSPDGQHVAMFTKLYLYLCNRQLEILATVHETVRIKSGAWEEHSVFIYTTSNHIKYSLLNG